MYPKNYVVFDFETTGLDPKKDKILEIGALKIEETKKPEEFQCLINHGIPVPEEITKITSITQEMIDKEGLKPEEAYQKFVEFVGRQDMIFVGHNALRFDVFFLQQAIQHPYFINIEYRCVDTAALFKAQQLGMKREDKEKFYFFAKRIFNIYSKVKYNVGVACDTLGIDRSKIQQHRALADVILTNEIYRKLCLSIVQPELNIQK